MVGGLAVSIHGEVRFTRDVDLAVAVADDAAAEHLVCGLRAEGFENLALIRERGYDRGEDLDAKLASLLEEIDSA